MEGQCLYLETCEWYYAALVDSSFHMLHWLQDVRRSALQCLLRLSTIKENVMLYKQEVLQGLTPCLADRKRIVRQVAAQASSLW